MSCLTRKLQHKLTRYLKKREDLMTENSIENVKEELINQGLCPSHITDDQIREIVRSASR
jgi:hypothetical protein